MTQSTIPTKVWQNNTGRLFLCTACGHTQQTNVGGCQFRCECIELVEVAPRRAIDPSLIVTQPNCEGEWYEEQPDGTWIPRLVTWEEEYDIPSRKYYRVWVVLKHGAYGLKTRPVPGRWYREQNTQELLESLAAGASP